LCIIDAGIADQSRTGKIFQNERIKNNMTTSFNTNLTNAVTDYLQKLNTRVTKTSLTRQLEQNAYFPTLYSVSEVLTKFNIPNEAFTLEAQHLDELQPPFIAYCNNTPNGKDFLLVTSVTPTTVSFVSNTGKEKKVSRERFLQDWEKIILVAEPTAESGEPGYLLSLRKEQAHKRKAQWLQFTGLATIIAIIARFIFLPGSTLIPIDALIVITKLAGCTLSLLLLLYELGRSNSFVKSLCSSGKQTSCDAVLSSKAKGIAGISWSEAGFFYFLASTIFLLSPAFTFAEKIPWLALTATLVSPYILFSIYYQYKIVKQWCPLCLAVQGILLLELVWAIATYWQKPVSPAGSFAMISTLAIAILVPVTVWFLLKPLLQKARDSTKYEAAYKRLLYNPEHFNQLLQQQQQAPGGWQELGITVGNPLASRSIVKVCNPYCGPCAKAHPVLEEIIHNNSDVNLKIIFTATNKENDHTAKPVKHLLAIAAKNKPGQIEQALDDWYNADKKDYSVFADKYPMNGELKQQEEKVEDMVKWCKEAGITATPTIFINGRALPETYNIDELKNIF
jgi:uncharacterized membrane protein